jgi:DNA-binding transcriptional regulator/RsmH inhibitor MraZ
MFLGNFERTMGKDGMILIPKSLRNDELKDGVVVAGCGDHIEIWSKERWASEQSKMKEVLSEVLN